MPQNQDGPRLPVKQLTILAVARFAEPLALTSVFPYLPEMVASFGVEKQDIAKWAGVTSATFSLAQSVTAVPWGRASDQMGRKPAIMLGLACTSTCLLVWGFSTSLAMAITVRAVMGASNGNVGIIRTMVAELVTEKEHQPRAFSIMPLVWSIGSIFGPAFGGFFAKPVDQFPSVFENSTFFKKFPFALPNMLAFCVFLLSLTTAALFLKETLASKRDSRDWGIVLGKRLTAPFKRHHHHRHECRNRRFSFQDGEATAPLLRDQAAHGHKSISRDEIATKVPPPSIKNVFSRQSTINLISYTFLALHSVAFDQILPVFLNYPVEHHRDSSNSRLPFHFNGGFGLESGRIGTIFTLYGIVCGLVQFIVFPSLCARFGVLNCLKGCALTFPLVYIVTPFTVLIQNTQLRFAALFAALVVKAFAVIVGFPCTTILLTNSASSLNILGTLNGFATTFSALGRAIGPALAGVIFSWGVKRDFIAAPWWALAAIALVGAVPTWWIEEGSGPSGESTNSSESGSPEESDEESDDTAPEEERLMTGGYGTMAGNGGRGA